MVTVITNYTVIQPKTVIQALQDWEEAKRACVPAKSSAGSLENNKMASAFD